MRALPENSRAQAVRPFEDRDRTDWHYTPRSRNGLSFKDMDKAGRESVHALLRTALSSAGYRKAVDIIELEIVLREIETFGWMRDPERYHLTSTVRRTGRAAAAGVSKATTCRSTSRSPATGWRSTRRASSAPIPRRSRQVPGWACAC